MRFDNFVAYLVLAASLVVSFFAYEAVMEIERPSQALLNSLPLGKKEHFVLHGKDCVGSFVTTFQVEPESTIISKGTVNFSYQGEVRPAKVFVGVYFNVLQQFVAGNMTFETEGANIRVKLANPNPITIDITADIRGRAMEKTFTLPGPLFLRSNGDKTYRIDYQALSTLLRSYSPAQAASMKEELDITITSGAETEAICGVDEKTGMTAKVFELDPLVTRFQAALAAWQPFYSF